MLCTAQPLGETVARGFNRNQQHEIVLGLNRELRVAFYNRAYVRFHQQNTNSPDAFYTCDLGASMLDGINGPMRDFYRRHMLHVLQTTQEWVHRYECSSPTLFRQFEMTIQALADGSGLMVRHTLLEEKPHDDRVRRPQPQNYAKYMQEQGFIVQCSSCRRIRRQQTLDWDWVPTWVQNPPLLLSHAICPECLPKFLSEALSEKE